MARKDCTSAGEDVIGNACGVAHISRVFRERFAPDAIDSSLQDGVKFSHFRRTDLMEFDMLRKQAEARMRLGDGFPDEFVSAMCM